MVLCIMWSTELWGVRVGGDHWAGWSRDGFFEKTAQKLYRGKMKVTGRPRREQDTAETGS